MKKPISELKHIRNYTPYIYNGGILIVANRHCKFIEINNVAMAHYTAYPYDLKTQTIKQNEKFLLPDNRKSGLRKLR